MKEEMVIDATEELESSSEMIFVQVDLKTHYAFAKNLKETLAFKISFEEKEKKVLDGNTLKVSYDNNARVWKIEDTKKKLNKELKDQLIELLEKMYKGNSVSFQVHMLWI